MKIHATEIIPPIETTPKIITGNLLSYNLPKSNFPQPLVKHEVFVESKPRKLEDDGKHAG